MAAAGTGIDSRRTAAGESLSAADLSSVAPVMLPPLLAPSAGAFAAAAVMGFGFANQMAGAYLGFLKGAMESGRLMAEALGVPDRIEEEQAPAPVAAEVVAEADPATRTATILPMARKAAEPAPATQVRAKEKAVRPSGKPGKTVKPAVKAKADTDAKTKAAEAGRTQKLVKAKPAKIDLSDLKRLPGVGPKLEQMLKARGIATLADVAHLGESAVQALDAELGLDGRIVRDGWVRTANELLS